MLVIFIISLGSINTKIGGSEYLKTIHNKIEGPIHNFDVDTEILVQELCLYGINEGIIKSRT